MTKQTAFYVAIFSTAALAVGWYARAWREASSSVAATLKRLAAFTNERGRFAANTALIAVVTAVVLYIVAIKHK